MVTLQGKAEVRCGKGAGFLVFPSCSEEGRADRSDGSAALVYDRLRDAGYIPCSFSQVEKLRGMDWQPGSCATKKSSFLDTSCAWLVMV